MSLRWRMALVASAVTAVLFLLAGAAVGRQLGLELQGELDDQLVERADTIGTAAVSLANLDQSASFATSDLALGVQVIENGATTATFGDVPDWIGAVELGVVRTVEDRTERWRVLDVEVSETEDTSVRFVSSLESIDDRTTRIRRRVFAAGVFATALAFITTWLLGMWATRPLQRLQEAAQRAGADPLTTIPVDQGVADVDDIGVALAESIERLHAETERTKSALEQSRRFAADVAHEVKTPLTAMALDLSVIDNPELGAKDRAELTASITRQHQRALARLDAIRRLARGDAGHASDLRPIDLADLVEEAIARTITPTNEVTVRVDLPERAPITGWADGLTMAIENLLDNAVKHGRGARPSVAIDVTLRSEDTRWLLVISDDGPGVDEHTDIFERFARGASTADGTGLGLSLVAQQAELHGGTISVGRSDPGASFELRLPRRT